MKRIIFIGVFLLSCNFLPFCYAQEKIVIAGTGDYQLLLRELADDFQKANPGIKVEVPDTVGSSGGIRSVFEGKSDLARVARAPKGKELAYNLQYKVFAYSPVAFVVSSNVKGVHSLSPGQILGIFSGKITSWKDLGWQPEKIYIAQREVGDSSRVILEEKLPGWHMIEDFAGEVIYTTPELVSIISRYNSTIGYAPLSIIQGSGLTVLAVSGVMPTLDNVKNGNYKLTVPFGLVWKGELKGPAKAFFDFVFSQQGQKIISEHQALPVE